MCSLFRHLQTLFIPSLCVWGRLCRPHALGFYTGSFFLSRFHRFLFFNLELLVFFPILKEHFSLPNQILVFVPVRAFKCIGFFRFVAFLKYIGIEYIR